MAKQSDREIFDKVMKGLSERSPKLTPEQRVREAKRVVAKKRAEAFENQQRKIRQKRNRGEDVFDTGMFD